MFNCEQLRTLIIRPALKDLLLHTEDAEELMIFTCANESLGGTYLKQVKGPALGIYQMEPETYNDLWQNHIKKKTSILLILLHAFNIINMPEEDRLIYDLRYATAMTRIYYSRIPTPLPKAIDLDGLWNYYKTYYNTSLGKADYHQALENYQRFIKS